MKVQIGSQSYIISWHHIREDADRRTQCNISIVEPDNTSRLLVQGEAYCNAVDNYDKNKGRKISLTRALTMKVPNPINAAAEWQPLFNTVEREAIWVEYFKMRGQW